MPGPGSLPTPEQWWRNPRALRYAREAALGHARRCLEARRKQASEPQLFHAAHEGTAHLEFFRSELAAGAARLGPGGLAVEVGAGMGWLAALVAAHSGGRVLATEPSWGTGGPYRPGNYHTFWRLKDQDEVLAGALGFERSTAGGLSGIRFPAGLRFARAAGEALPLRNGEADFVYTYNCLEHIADLEGFLAEAARVLREGGRMYHATEPLYFSIHGHHLEDVFPLPWGHLLWEAEELAELVVREAGEDREWAPGVPLRPDHLAREVFGTLNGAPPGRLRRALLAGPWEVEAWADWIAAEDEALAGELRLDDALRGVSREALLLRGLRMQLRRREGAGGLRSALRFPATWRRTARRWLRRRG